MKIFTRSTMALVATLFFTQAAKAQSTITIGPKVGASYSWISGKDATSDQDGRVGLVAGGFLTYSSDKMLGFTAEVFYAGKGTSYKSDGDKTTILFHYVDVPLLLKIFLSKTGSVRPNIFLGPSANFLVKAEGKNDAGDKTDITSSFKSFELGAVGGIGVNIKTLENQWLNFDVRYNYGITNLSDVEIAGETSKTHNIGVVLAASYAFGF